MRILCFEANFVGWKGKRKNNWKREALKGPEYRIQAIKYLWEQHKNLPEGKGYMSVKEAKDTVVAFIAKRTKSKIKNLMPRFYNSL